MDVSRREFFTRFGQSFARSLSRRLLAVRDCASTETSTAAGRQRRWLRPPGAISESDFKDVCTRCTDCQDACPFTAIRRLGPEFGEDAGTPAVIPHESPCYLCAEMPCIVACEPRALAPTAMDAVAMGIAVLDWSSCYLWQAQPCDYCVTRCPLPSKAIGWSADRRPEIDEEKCTGCGVCAYLCPRDAIAILPNIQ